MNKKNRTWLHCVKLASLLNQRTRGRSAAAHLRRRRVENRVRFGDPHCSDPIGRCMQAPPTTRNCWRRVRRKMFPTTTPRWVWMLLLYCVNPKQHPIRLLAVMGPLESITAIITRRLQSLQHYLLRRLSRAPSTKCRSGRGLRTDESDCIHITTGD